MLDLACSVQWSRSGKVRDGFYFQLFGYERSMSAAILYRLTMINDLKGQQRNGHCKVMVLDGNSAVASLPDAGNKRWQYWSAQRIWCTMKFYSLHRRRWWTFFYTLASLHHFLGWAEQRGRPILIGQHGRWNFVASCISRGFLFIIIIRWRKSSFKVRKEKNDPIQVFRKRNK